MKRFAMLLIALIACTVAVGYYRDWFTVSNRHSDSDTHKVNVTLTVDPDKVKEDATKAKDKAINFRKDN
jgi:hypothetical protein